MTHFGLNPTPADELPWLTADLPGIGGRIQVLPEDFRVEEIPAYEPAGSGNFVFLWVEKRDCSAEQLLAHLAQRLGVRRGEVGMAGLKDRRAIARQYVSVPAACLDRLAAVEDEHVRVLHFRLHPHKLRSGHVRGNRFSILVRDVPGDAAERASAVAARILADGLPNYFGRQRFGREGETLRWGHALLGGQRTARDMPPARRRFLLKLALSAAQADLFNAVLAERLADGLFTTVLAGDVMRKTDTGGLFVAEEAAAEQVRFERRETAITGPIFGVKMKQPGGEPLQRETRVLSRRLPAGAALETALGQYKRLLSGSRRPLRVFPENLAYAMEPEGLRLEFALPRGAYATVLLGELMKDRSPTAA